MHNESVITATDVQRVEAGNHPITADKISPNALKVLKNLAKHGYNAYLVGGCIRDIYLGITPKDYDIVTNASPEEIKKCFNNCRLIGRRFRLAHIRYGREIIEVATFRANTKTHEDDHRVDGETGMLLRDNVYGTIEDDVFRRDFTINALYYCHNTQTVIDYIGGLADIKQRTLRIIGDPSVRYQEDPVRMLRAVRHVAKLNLQFDEATRQAIKPLGHTLEQIAPARLFEEYIKLFTKGAAVKTFEQLQEFDLLHHLFPAADALFRHEDSSEQSKKLILIALENTDNRINQDKTINPGFLIAVFLWHVYERELEMELSYEAPRNTASYQASMTAIRQQSQHVSVPKRFAETVRHMWDMQYRLHKRFRKNIYRCLEHPKFRAAYDLMVLRTQANPNDKALKECADWWTKLQAADSNERKQIVNQLRSQHNKAKKS